MSAVDRYPKDWALVQVATMAGKREIFLSLTTAVLLGDTMLDV